MPTRRNGWSAKALAPVSGERTLLSSIHYSAYGQVEEETAGNGVRTWADYSPVDGRLDRLRAGKPGGPVMQDLTYTYDPVGNILSIRDDAQPVRHFNNQRIEPINTYRYDTLYQLIEATGRETASPSHGPALPDRMPSPVDANQLANYTQTFTYDAGGNLTTLRHVGARSFTREMDVAALSNRSVIKGELDLDTAFDGNGNLLQLQPGQRLEWDARNQLRQVTPVERVEANDDCERYIYDAGGERVRKQRTTQARAITHRNEVRYLPGLELSENSATGETLEVITVLAGRSQVRVLHWESGKPPGIDNNQVRYCLNDHLGSSSLELDGEGAVISQEHFYPYGDTAWWAGRSVTQASYKTIRYSGKERDASGLYYYGFRYYAPWLGRWLNPDPMGTADGMNVYTFVHNNPLCNIDTDGRLTEEQTRAGMVIYRGLRRMSGKRKQSVKTIAPGIIGVALQGNTQKFEDAGISLSRSFKGRRALIYLSIDSTYRSKIVGESGGTAVKSASPEDLYNAIGVPKARWSAYINGGFFNFGRRADPELPEEASIGGSYIGFRSRPSAAIPQGYEGDYKRLDMDDSSFIHSGPLLATGGQPTFTQADLQHLRFQFDPDQNFPGRLGHANQSNNRSAISLPAKNGDTSARTRLVVGLGSGRSATASGYTLPEWAQVLARLDRLNAVPGHSVNLDGGDSSGLGVIDSTGRKLMSAAAAGNPHRQVGNFIALSRTRRRM